MRATGRWASGSEGAVLVEFAVMLPLLLALIFGIIDFGRAYDAKQALTHATREAVREYAVSQDQSDGEAAFWQAVGSLDANNVSVAVPSDGCTAGEPVTVTATYQFDFLALPFASVTLDSEGVMRCGG